MRPAARSLQVDGVDRRFLVAEPNSNPSMIMLSLHGTRSSALGQVRLSRMSGLAERAGAVVVFPEAIARIGSGFEWDHERDMPFLHQLVTDVIDRYPTPSRRVAITGMSGGARMSCHYAAAHPEAVTMVGAVAGIRAPDAGPMSRPVPILAFHGTADRINPYTGSGTARWGESVPEAARKWAVANGVSGVPMTSAASATLSRETYGNPGQPGEVTLWTSRNAGHTWPGTPLGLLARSILGRPAHDIDATEAIHAFAVQHSTEP